MKLEQLRVLSDSLLPLEAGPALGRALDALTTWVDRESSPIVVEGWQETARQELIELCSLLVTRLAPLMACDDALLRCYVRELTLDILIVQATQDYQDILGGHEHAMPIDEHDVWV